VEIAMAVEKYWGRLGLALLLLLPLGSGCSGVLMEKQLEDGKVDRVKIDGGESWSTYEYKSVYPRTRTKDEYSIVIKREATF
jgi:hypothetical protein